MNTDRFSTSERERRRKSMVSVTSSMTPEQLSDRARKAARTRETSRIETKKKLQEAEELLAKYRSVLTT